MKFLLLIVFMIVLSFILLVLWSPVVCIFLYICCTFLRQQRLSSSLWSNANKERKIHLQALPGDENAPHISFISFSEGNLGFCLSFLSSQPDTSLCFLSHSSLKLLFRAHLYSLLFLIIIPPNLTCIDHSSLFNFSVVLISWYCSLVDFFIFCVLIKKCRNH